MNPNRYYREDKKEKLYVGLERCTCENRRDNTYPFFFEMKNQKIMLITLVPSFQAVYRQLASIRFFRQIFLAMCGPKPNIRGGSLVSSFLEAFYWTHYHKCYIPRPRGETVPYADQIPKWCYDEYIEKELRILKPKVIVVLGDATAQKLFNIAIPKGEVLEEYFYDIPVVCAHFPKGDEPEFKEIRERMRKEGISWVDTSPVPEYMVPTSSDTVDTLAVHSNFEMKSLYALWKSINKSTIKSHNNVDDMWIEREVVPRWERNAFLVSCVMFLEDQINLLLAENPDINRQGTEIEERMSFIFPNNSFSAQYLDDIKTLRLLRNKIVHNGGRVEPGERLLYRIKKTPGLPLEPSGIIIVTDQYCQKVLKMVNNFVDEFSRLRLRRL